MKNSNDIIGNRTRDLPGRSAAPSLFSFLNARERDQHYMSHRPIITIQYILMFFFTENGNKQNILNKFGSRKYQSLMS
jgi:hypothetical protein